MKRSTKTLIERLVDAAMTAGAATSGAVIDIRTGSMVTQLKELDEELLEYVGGLESRLDAIRKAAEELSADFPMPLPTPLPEDTIWVRVAHVVNVAYEQTRPAKAGAVPLAFEELGEEGKDATQR